MKFGPHITSFEVPRAPLKMHIKSLAHNTITLSDIRSIPVDNQFFTDILNICFVRCAFETPMHIFDPLNNAPHAFYYGFRGIAAQNFGIFQSM